VLAVYHREVHTLPEEDRRRLRRPSDRKMKSADLCRDVLEQRELYGRGPADDGCAGYAATAALEAVRAAGRPTPAGAVRARH
jgi:hypothetical protein